MVTFVNIETMKDEVATECGPLYTWCWYLIALPFLIALTSRQGVWATRQQAVAREWRALFHSIQSAWKTFSLNLLASR